MVDDERAVSPHEASTYQLAEVLFQALAMREGDHQCGTHAAVLLDIAPPAFWDMYPQVTRLPQELTAFVSPTMEQKRALVQAVQEEPVSLVLPAGILVLGALLKQARDHADDPDVRPFLDDYLPHLHQFVADGMVIARRCVQ